MDQRPIHLHRTHQVRIGRILIRIPNLDREIITRLVVAPARPMRMARHVQAQDVRIGRVARRRQRIALRPGPGLRFTVIPIRVDVGGDRDGLPRTDRDRGLIEFLPQVSQVPELLRLRVATRAKCGRFMNPQKDRSPLTRVVAVADADFHVVVGLAGLLALFDFSQVNVEVRDRQQVLRRA